MTNLEKENQKKNEQVDEHAGMNLKGTFISVLVLCAFIIASWVGVWSIFISR